MTIRKSNERAQTLVDSALSTEKRERLSVRADFSAQVVRSAAVQPSRVRRAGFPLIVLVAASALAASTAIAGIVQFVQREKVSDTVACPECPIETQFLLASPEIHSGPAGAQSLTERSVPFTEDLRISGANHKFFDLRVSASGMVSAMEGEKGGLLRVYSPAGREVATIDPPLSPGSSRLHWGWVGESIWVYDTRELVQHVIALSPTPHVVSSRLVPLATSGPPGTTPQMQPAIGGAGGASVATGGTGSATAVAAGAGGSDYPRIYAVFPDGGLLRNQRFSAVEARTALGRLDLNDADTPTGFLVRTNADDNFVSFLPSNPLDWRDDCDRISPVPGLYGPISMGIPWCGGKQRGISPNGRRVAYSIGEAPVGDPAVVRVAQVLIGGDTVFSREYRIPSLPITTAQADSIYARLVTSAITLAEPRLQAFRDSILRNEMPTHRQPLDFITVGNDGSVLLHLFLHTPDRRYLLLDPKGEPVGTFALPRGVLALEVNGNTIWGVATQPDETKDLVRYVIKP